MDHDVHYLDSTTNFFLKFYKLNQMIINNHCMILSIFLAHLFWSLPFELCDFWWISY